MRTARQLLILSLLAIVPLRLSAQHGGGASTSTPAAPKEGAQFDFLIGQWELSVKPLATTLGQRIHGVPKLLGTWKAWRALDGWGIHDEIRLSDASGNPRLFSSSVRFFDAKARRWSISSIDVYKNVQAQSTAEWRGSEMVISGSGVDDEGKPFTSRATFSKITAKAFSYRLDRSTDGGKTWTEGITKIDAVRVAAVAPR